jgi:hypothetical protein
MLLVTRLLTSSEQTCEPMASSSVNSYRRIANRAPHHLNEAIRLTAKYNVRVVYPVHASRSVSSDAVRVPVWDHQ